LGVIDQQFMENHFKRINSNQELEDLIARSSELPVVVFKHSTTCPISAGAYREMMQLGGDVALIEVQKAGELSREIAQRTGVDHESPQVIVLRDGKAVWHASHWKVRASAVQQAIVGSAGIGKL
jgi:bacillithiol system protein YtxJ